MVNFIQRPARQFAETVFATADNMNATAFTGYFATDGVFVFANWSGARGSSAIQTMVDNFFKSIEASRHEVLEVWRPVGDKFSDYRICIDLTPLFAPTSA
ncbi:MAG: hypothetical protein POG24_00065 [Acidocella sp.]|nr:hypothetical protein [Acidocella sp.]MDE8350139.1 hypothetical protein [Acidocella sp.]